MGEISYEGRRKNAKRARGECRQCKAPALPDRALCAIHLEEHRARVLANRKLRIECGTCLYCDLPAITDHRCCAVHYARYKKWQRAYRAKRRSEGKT